MRGNHTIVPPSVSACQSERILSVTFLLMTDAGSTLSVVNSDPVERTDICVCEFSLTLRACQ